ncbi:HAD-IIB family hydrolase [Myxococcota bacterium]|nr:HAD-IIB family hydrolase [Myxococcota bacterium]
MALRSRPIRSFDAVAASRLGGVFTDIDGTLTDPDGRIPAASFAALERLRGAGLRTVVVTGRPAGWCDMIARTWPVDAVVGENGGLWFMRDGERLVRRYRMGEEERRASRARLEAVAWDVLAEVPGAALASDQPYREFDLAVDFREDVAPLEAEAVDRIVAIFHRHGATAKVSNIHVNGWFGSWDKLTACRDLVRDAFGGDLDAERDLWTFFGDSPNDEPMFAFFPLAIGVANIARFAGDLVHHPGFVTEGDGARGFVEGVDVLLGAPAIRRSRRG